MPSFYCKTPYAVRVPPDHNRHIMGAGRKSVCPSRACNVRDRAEQENARVGAAAARPRCSLSAPTECAPRSRSRSMSASRSTPPLSADRPASLPDAGSPLSGTMTDIAEPVAEEAVTWSPPRRSTASWVVFDIGDTVFQQVMITNYFTLWVAAAGGSATHIAFANSISMALMLGVGPWIGAVSDHLPRRVPLLMVLVTGCCLLTFFVGGSLWTGLALFLGANLFFQSGVVIYDALLPAVSTPENRGRVGGFAVGLSNLGAVLGIGLGVLVLHSGGHYETIFKLTAVIFLLLALPCLLWVKEPLRAVSQVAPLTAARGALRDILTTARRARDYPDLIRFLVGR